MTRRKTQSERPTRHDVAADWMLRRDERPLTGVEEAQLDAWLADPQNELAWRSVTRAADVVANHAGSEDMLAIRAVALATKPEPQKRLRWGIAASLVLVLLGAGTYAAIGDHQAPSVGPKGAGYVAANANYRTAVGERATFSLPDGSTVTLDTSSAVQIAYTPGERGVRLLRGQALFDVAKHKTAPFRVYAAGQAVTAVGTRFNVRLDGEGTASKVYVALVEGVVKVTPTPFLGPIRPSARDVTLSAGEVLAVTPEAPARVAAADTERLTSWRTGVLVFNEAPLREAVAEMNRYTTRPITLADNRIGAYRLNGVYRTGDPQRFAEIMTELFPLDLSASSDEGFVLTRRNVEGAK